MPRLPQDIGEALQLEPAAQAQLLRRVDDVVIQFELLTGQADAGFNDFVRRHQQAMGLGTEPRPGWPNFQKRSGDWDTDVWKHRYRSFVRVRDRLVEARLKYHFKLGGKAILDFWGVRPETPERAWASMTKGGKVGRGIRYIAPRREFWWQSVDARLEWMARAYEWDAEETRNAFWSDIAVDTGPMGPSSL